MRVSCLPVSATYSWACIQMRRHKEKIAKMQRCMQCAAPVSRVRQVAWVARAREKKIEGPGSWGALALFSLDISRDPPAVRARRRRRPDGCRVPATAATAIASLYMPNPAGSSCAASCNPPPRCSPSLSLSAVSRLPARPLRPPWSDRACDWPAALHAINSDGAPKLSFSIPTTKAATPAPRARDPPSHWHAPALGQPLRDALCEGCHVVIPTNTSSSPELRGHPSTCAPAAAVTAHHGRTP